MAAFGDGINAVDEEGVTQLHIAAESGDGNTVRRLLDRGADPNQPDAERRQALHLAVEANSVESIEPLLEAGANPNVRQAYLNQTPLHRAALFGAAESTQRLLQAGADPDARDHLGDTPLHLAVSNNASEEAYLATVHRLLDGGADPNLPDTRSGSTPLREAAAFGKSETVDRLLAGGADPLRPDKDGFTPLHEAARHSSALTQRLLQAGASPHARSRTGSTPLHVAAEYGAATNMDRLLEAGADLNAQDDAGNTALHYLAEGRVSGAGRLTSALLERGASPDIKNNDGLTPLEAAAAEHGNDAIRVRQIREAFDEYRTNLSPSQGHETPMPAELEHDLYAVPAAVQFRYEVDLDSQGMSPLHEATLDDSVLQINEALEDGHDLDARDRDGATPLHWAVAQNSHQAVERLLEAGADPDSRDSEDRTPLHWGANYGSTEAVDRLLEAEADPNARDERGETALHKAAAWISPETVERLLEAEADPNARNHRQETPLHRAHFALYPETVERLLKAGADPEARDGDGDTPLHRATVVRANRSMEVMLKAGANPDGRNADDNTPLHRAAHLNYPECAARLLDAGADPDARNANGKTPLLIAAHHPSAKTVECLLDAGANHDVRDNEHKATPLHQAAAYGALDSADRLLEAGADPDACDVDGETPLHRAVGSGWSPSCSDMVKHLVEGGADPDPVESQHGRTPLNLAAELDNQDAVEPLLKGGANPHIQDHEGHTALHAAARLPKADLVDRLLDGGADPHIHGVNRGDTALMQAAAHGSTESVERLLKAGADPDARDNDGASALHYAAGADKASTVDRLIKGGAYHQAIDNQDRTPLHAAAEVDASKCINRLLKAGANMYVHDAHGRTPLELARESDSHAAVSRLEQAAAERRPRIQRFINRFRPRARNAPDVIAQGRMVKQVSDKPGPGRIEKTIPEQDQQQQLPKEKPMPQEHWSNSKSARQFTEQVATRVAPQVEEGKAPWQKGYDKPSDADLQPFNPTTGKRFKGLNAIQLKSVAQEKGYNDPRWMSLQAANRVGTKVRKGERGTRVEYLRFPPKSQASPGKDSPEAAAGDKQQEQPRISHHTYVVFNAEQIERMPSLEQQLPKEPQQHKICERAERMIQDSGVKIENPPPDGHSYTKYDKDRDTVVIPGIEKFKSPEHYYGHAVKQMAGRAAGEQHTERPEPQGEAQQRDATARQDMRREMATDTICSKLHLPKQPTGERHKAQWAETIRNSPNELRYAARDADRMADQVLSHDRPQQRSQAEPSRESSIAQVTPERVQQTQRALEQLQQQPEREMAAAMSR